MDAAFTPTEAISSAWELVKKNLGLFVPLAVLQLVVTSIEGSTARGAHGSALLHFAAQVAGIVLAMGWWRIALRVTDGRAVGLAAITEVSLVPALMYFVTTLLVGFVVVVGLVLLIVPGILWALQFGLAPILVVDEGIDPVAAMRRSSELTRGARGDLFVLALLLFALNLAGALALGVGLLVTLPVSAMAIAHAYRRLQARAASARPAVSSGAAVTA